MYGFFNSNTEAEKGRRPFAAKSAQLRLAATDAVDGKRYMLIFYGGQTANLGILGCISQGAWGVSPNTNS